MLFSRHTVAQERVVCCLSNGGGGEFAMVDFSLRGWEVTVADVDNRLEGGRGREFVDKVAVLPTNTSSGEWSGLVISHDLCLRSACPVTTPPFSWRTLPPLLHFFSSPPSPPLAYPYSHTHCPTLSLIHSLSPSLLPAPPSLPFFAPLIPPAKEEQQRAPSQTTPALFHQDAFHL